MKIGILSHTLRRHSCGWFIRSLLPHLSQSNDIYLYALQQRSDSISDELRAIGRWFDCAGLEPDTIANRIIADGLDVLIDIDSITFDLSVGVLIELWKRKSRPAIVGWLGFDASPLCDFFIADPYVLPSDAQQHYSAKILRMPSTYIACDGFEMSLPSWGRSDLGISDDQVVLLTTQKGFKLSEQYLDTCMEVLRKAPESVLLIKYYTSAIKEIWYRAIEQAGVEGQIIFIPPDDSEEISRANIFANVDACLDSFPYNGTTTTLEALWAGVPVVSLCGEGFHSRQGYTLLQNAGVPYLCAESIDDYIDRAVSLANSSIMRDSVRGQLAKKWRSALWDSRQFAIGFEGVLQGAVRGVAA